MRLLGDRQELNVLERRMALMRVAGAGFDTIAYMLETNEQQVRNTLKRPHVANMVLLLTGMVADGLEGGIVDLNAAIESASHEAFQVELDSMRELQEIGQLALEPQHVIKAKVEASNIAQDILDRAGKRAPTRVVSATVSGKIPDAQIGQLVNVMNEMLDKR